MTSSPVVHCFEQETRRCVLLLWIKFNESIMGLRKCCEFVSSLLFQGIFQMTDSLTGREFLKFDVFLVTVYMLLDFMIR